MYIINGKHYRLVDFFSEFTTEQSEEALKLLTPYFENETIKNLLAQRGGGIEDVIAIAKLLQDASDTSKIRRLLAIFYVEEGKEFDAERLPETMQEMGKARVVPMLREALGGFFTFKTVAAESSPPITPPSSPLAVTDTPAP